MLNDVDIVTSTTLHQGALMVIVLPITLAAPISFIDQDIVTCTAYQDISRRCGKVPTGVQHVVTRPTLQSVGQSRPPDGFIGCATQHVDQLTRLKSVCAQQSTRSIDHIAISIGQIHFCKRTPRCPCIRQGQLGLNVVVQAVNDDSVVTRTATDHTALDIVHDDQVITRTTVVLQTQTTQWQQHIVTCGPHQLSCAQGSGVRVDQIATREKITVKINVVAGHE